MAWALLLALIAMPQVSPVLTGVEPTTCNVGDTVTVTGENLGGNSIQEVLLANVEESPPENFYPAEVLERRGEKIMMKIPQVEPGTYTLALNVADIYYISPSIQITVE